MIVRKNWAKMTTGERTAFERAVDAMIDDGSYGELVWHHMHPQGHMYKMHSNTRYDQDPVKGREIGGKRFLPWHRIYLTKFEEKLREHDSNLFIPCWSWWEDGDILDPDSDRSWNWIIKFHTANNGKGRKIEVRNPSSGKVEDTIEIQREIGEDHRVKFPTRKGVGEMLHENTDLSHLAFSRALEGNPHNHGHMWVGGTMNSLKSPADSLFWMHHAEIDRLWEIWRSEKTKDSELTSGITEEEAKEGWATLKPWEDHIETVLNTDPTKYGYKYDESLDDYSKP